MTTNITSRKYIFNNMWFLVFTSVEKIPEGKNTDRPKLNKFAKLLAYNIWSVFHISGHKDLGGKFISL